MFFHETFPSCPEKATFSRSCHGATIHSFVMYVEWHPHGSLQILFVFWISSCELKSRLNTWISWKVVAGCTGSLQTKQQAITCFSGYELTTANSVQNRVSANSGLTLINTTNINFQLLHVRLPFKRRERSCCSIIYYIDWNIYISYRYIYPFDEWFPKIGLCNVLKRKTQLTQSKYEYNQNYIQCLAFAFNKPKLLSVLCICIQ